MEELCLRYESKIEELLSAVETQAYDGAWYLRGFYDDGGKLGSRERDDCKIDVLPQAFSMIAADELGLDKTRPAAAMDSVYSILFDRENKLIRLLYPPFDADEQYPVILRGMFRVSGKTAVNIRMPRFGLPSDFWPVMRTTGVRKRCLPSIPRCGMRIRRLRKNTKLSRMCWRETFTRTRSMRDAAAGAGIPVPPHGIARQPWRCSAVIRRKTAGFTLSPASLAALPRLRAVGFPQGLPLSYLRFRVG